MSKTERRQNLEIQILAGNSLNSSCQAHLQDMLPLPILLTNFYPVMLLLTMMLCCKEPQLVVLYEIPEGAKLSTKIDFYITLDIGLLWWTWHTSSEFHDDRSKCTDNTVVGSSLFYLFLDAPSILKCPRDKRGGKSDFITKGILCLCQFPLLLS